MSYAIVIVSWNTKQLLAQCLEALESEILRYGLTGSEIIVVDNASADGTPEMVRRQFPTVTLVANGSNVGFARANNQGIAHGRGRHLLLLNPDTKVKPGALWTLTQHMETHPSVGAVGPMLLNPDGTLQVSCYPAPTLPREFWRLFHLDLLYPYGSYWMHRWSSTSPRTVDVLMGACLLVRREVLDQVGWLDEDYYIYSEEVDLCYRIRRAGWQIDWVPTAQVIHYGGQSTQQIASEMFIQLYQSKILYFRKNYGSHHARIYKLCLLLAAAIRLLLVPLIWLATKPKRKRYRSIANNYRLLLQRLLRL